MIRLGQAIFALIATATPAFAQFPVDLPSHEQVAAIRAFAMIGAAGRLCPHLTTNLRHAHHLAALFRFHPDDLRGRFRPLAGLVRAEFEALAVQQPHAFCALAWSYFGDGGQFPGVLVRR